MSWLSVAARLGRELMKRRVRCVENDIATDPHIEPVACRNRDRRLHVQVPSRDLHTKLRNLATDGAPNNFAGIGDGEDAAGPVLR